MRVITVARKPLGTTVARTALEFGTGGLNIDRSRLGTEEPLTGGAYAENTLDRPNPEDWRFERGSGEYVQPSGRWPANLILEHHPECVKTGTAKVEGHLISHYDKEKANRAYGFYIPKGDKGEDQKLTNAERQADITVDVYHCHPKCPCLRLDTQTGVLTSGTRDNRHNQPYTSPSGWSGTNQGGVFTGSSGGASRYFKQVGGSVSED